MNKEEQELYDKFVNFVNNDSEWKKWQTQMAIEEATEFILSILHYLRGKGSREDVVSEIADLENMIGQMKSIYNISEREISEERIRKVQRTIEKFNIKL